MRTFQKICHFLLGGGLYTALEWLYRGRSHPSMFLLGGSCFLMLGHLRQKKMPLPAKAALGAMLITAGELVTGVSTRGAIALYKAAQVTAAISGRDYVIPEDVVREAIPVLAHRITAVSGSSRDAENYLKGRISSVAVPLENTSV